MKIHYRQLSVCFTGHRALYGYDWNNELNKMLFSNIYKTIENLILQSGVFKFNFYCGGALGVDQMAATAVLHLRKKYKGVYTIKVILAIPYKDQPSIWKGISKERYLSHTRLADELVYVDTIDKYRVKSTKVGEHHPTKLLNRNKYMLDQSDVLIAVYNKTSQKGGTYHCVKNAIDRGNIRIIYVDTQNRI